MKDFAIVFFTAAILENAIFSRALGLSRWARKQDSPMRVLMYGGIFSWMTFWSTIGALIITRLVNYAPENIAKYLKAPAYLFAVFLVYLGSYFLARRFLPYQFPVILVMLPISTFNTALFSVFYIINNQSYSFSAGIAYALGTGLGYTLALLILFFAGKRLALSPIPPSFKGLPIFLIYAGILSLALYGLVGYGVAA